MSRKLDEAAERPDEDSPELTRAMVRKMLPASEVLPQHIGQHATDVLMRRRRGRPTMDDKLVAETLRIAPDVLEDYKATGPGWRKLMEKTLSDHRPERK